LLNIIRVSVTYAATLVLTRRKTARSPGPLSLCMIHPPTLPNENCVYSIRVTTFTFYIYVQCEQGPSLNKCKVTTEYQVPQLSQALLRAAPLRELAHEAPQRVPGVSCLPMVDHGLHDLDQTCCSHDENCGSRHSRDEGGWRATNGAGSIPHPPSRLFSQ
jgi:hypothetical protein